ncbi:MAG: hypothetical protein P3W87_003935 [Gammaproteobacteria bacterium]|nr:hypothetical protein [Gammaproteobacteria bacterium]
MNIRSQENTADISSRVWSIVQALPQREAIDESDAKAWVEEVVARYGDQALWHAKRLEGFGGSEIGALVRNYHGVRAAHHSAHDIVEEKLMRRVPTVPKSHLVRGLEHEPVHAEYFARKWSARRDEEAYEALKQAKGSHPWMRYSPDDVVRMPAELVQTEDGRLVLQRSKQESLWLIDYKAPSHVTDTPVIPFQYSAQLHQGAILCAETGIDIDGMMLSQFNWEQWALKDDIVLWDENLGRLILEAGDHYWDYVLRGEVPAYVQNPVWTPAPEYIQSHQEVAHQYALLKALSDAAAERAEALRAQILEPLEGCRLSGQRIEFVAPNDQSKKLTVSANRVLDKEAVARLLTPEQMQLCEKKDKATDWDVDAMVQYLTEAGVDVNAFRRRKLDADKVFALMESLGLDAEQVVREQVILRVAPTYKEQMREYVAQVQDTFLSHAPEEENHPQESCPS